MDDFNNKKIYPRLKSLMAKDYFRYFQYQPTKKCPFWDSSSGTLAPFAGIVPGWVKVTHSYFASKHAVVSMTRTLGSSTAFKETGVKV